ncbi:fibronectin type III domain-containing protein [Agromyces sp. MMS24-JH15]|uniref:fibronectin type III domain-containing protein n=1 Tax=Agromyces sp. MMS24-JH15 TaxID=3243765 RepID=UPI0037489406
MRNRLAVRRAGLGMVSTFVALGMVLGGAAVGASADDLNLDAPSGATENEAPPVEDLPPTDELPPAEEAPVEADASTEAATGDAGASTSAIAGLKQAASSSTAPSARLAELPAEPTMTVEQPAVGRIRVSWSEYPGATTNLIWGPTGGIQVSRGSQSIDIAIPPDLWGVGTMISVQYYSDTAFLLSARQVVRLQALTPSATSPTPTSVDVTWPAVDGATGYTVSYRKAGTADWSGVDVAADVTAKTLTGLQPNTGYEVKVTATRSADEGTSTTIAVTTGSPEPLTVSASGVTASAFGITWTRPTLPLPPNRSSVEWLIGIDGQHVQAIAVEYDPTAAGPFAGYAPGSTHTVTVALVARLNGAPQQTTLASGTMTVTLPIPIQVAGVQTAKTEVTLSLSGAMDTALDVYRDDVRIGSTTVGAATYVDSAAIAGSHRYQLKDGHGNPRSNAATVVVNGPIRLTADQVGTTTAEIGYSLDSIAGVTKILWQVGTGNPVEITPVAQHGSFTVSGLTPGSTNSLAVKAYNGKNRVAIGNLDVVAKPVAEPIEVDATSFDATTIDLAWNPVGDTEYVVKWAVAGSGEWASAPAAGVGHHTITGLLPAHAYTIRVTGGGADSGEFTVTTLRSITTDLIGVTLDTATIAWDPDADADRYVVHWWKPGGHWTQEVSASEGTAFVIRGLDADTDYEFGVVAYTGKVAIGVAPADSFRTNAAPVVPAAPLAITGAPLAKTRSPLAKTGTDDPTGLIIAAVGLLAAGALAAAAASVRPTRTRARARR